MVRYNKQFDEALQVFDQLEDLEARLRRQEEVGRGVSYDLLSRAHQDAASRLLDLAQEETVSAFTRAIELQTATDREDLEFLRNDTVTDHGDIEEKEAELEEKQKLPEYRLVAWYAGIRALAGVDSPEKTTQNPEQEKSATESFLGRALDEVAEDMIGMGIRVGNGKTAKITDVLAQDGDYNRKFSDDPIFGEGRVDAMVAQTRGFNILYVRAGAPEDTSCVRITGIELGSDKFDKASKVTAALGLERDQIADVEVDPDSNTIRVLRVREIEKK